MNKEEFQKLSYDIIDDLKSSIASLRTGRATPALVEDLEVDYYGTKTSLKALASISSPEPRQLVIQPWDKNSLKPIEQAIQSSNLGAQPIADKDVIRITIPALTEERRKELVKVLGKNLEEARIRVRRDREEAIKNIEKEEKDKKISEDERFRKKNEIQKLVEEANKKIEDLGLAKEKEIMSV